MLPSALGHVPEIVGGGDELAVLLDYDGTLTPIISQPDQAVLWTLLEQFCALSRRKCLSQSLAAESSKTFASVLISIESFTLAATDLISPAPADCGKKWPRNFCPGST